MERHTTRRGNEAEPTCERFVGLFENTSDAVLVTTPDGRILEANAAAQRLFGFTLAELKALAPGALFAETADRERYVRRLSEEGAVSELEVPLRRKDGETITCVMTSTTRRDASGKIIEYQDIIRDVTKQRERERWLQVLRLALDSMQTGVTITDPDRKIVYVNRAEAQMHGWQTEELIGRPSSVLGAATATAPGPLPKEMARWQRITINRRKDGTTFPVSLLSDTITDDEGTILGLVTACQDMTEILEAEETIRTLSKAIEQSSSLVVITDTDGSITYVNPQFEKVTGYTLEEARGQTPSVLKSGLMDPTVYEELWQTISSGGVWTGELLNRKKNGGLYWCIATISGVRDEHGVIRHYVGIQQDITLRKRMEQELREKNVELERLNQFKSEAVATTAHDLKSPLNAMISTGMLLRDMGDALSPEQRQQALDQLVEAGQRLQRLIGHVLNAETFESGSIKLHLEEVDVAPLLESCAQTARQSGLKRGIKVDVSIETDHSIVLADPVRLEEVFNNLLGNAVKFSPDGGTITVRVARNRRSLEISVIDQGPGIPPGEESKIFDKYYQVHAGDQVAERGFSEAGLGLYISRQLVQLHGGSIRAENVAGGTGARFIVELTAGGSGPIEITSGTPTPRRTRVSP